LQPLKRLCCCAASLGVLLNAILNQCQHSLHRSQQHQRALQSMASEAIKQSNALLCGSLHLRAISRHKG
jgi:hypothetical protein